MAKKNRAIAKAEKLFIKNMLLVEFKKDKTFNDAIRVFKNCEVLSEAKKKYLMDQIQNIKNCGTRLGNKFIAYFNEETYFAWNLEGTIVEIIKQENILDLFREQFFEGLKIDNASQVVCEIHRSLKYFPVDSDQIERYYELEYLKYLCTMTEYQGYTINREYMKAIDYEFNNVLSKLRKNIVNTVRVWLLRELYYFYENLESTSFGKKEVNEALGVLYSGNKEAFLELPIVKGVRGFSNTNVDTYFNAYNVYHSSLRLPHSSQFNVLLNLSHCNGTMSTKYVSMTNKTNKKYPQLYSSINPFLQALTDGIFKKEIEREFYQTTGINPRMILGIR